MGVLDIDGMGLSDIEPLCEVQFRRCSLINQNFTQTEPIYLILSELPDVFFTTFTCRTVNSHPSWVIFA